MAEAAEQVDPRAIAKAAVERNRARRADQAELSDPEGPDLIRHVAEDEDGRKTSPEQAQDALEWFLADDSDEDFNHTIELNVGGPKRPVWIKWEIRPVDLDTLRRIRKAAQGNRQQRRRDGGELDEVEANLRIVVEATVKPDLKLAAEQKGYPNPVEALRAKFQRKPGILGQIAGEVMSLSGYDDEDVREVDAAGG